MLGEDAPKKPKSPQGAYFLFCNEKRPTLSGLGFKEVAEKVSAMWRELSADEKKVYEDRNAEQKEQFEKEMVEYRNHPAVKAFEKASGTAKKKPKKNPQEKKTTTQAPIIPLKYPMVQVVSGITLSVC